MRELLEEIRQLKANVTKTMTGRLENKEYPKIKSLEQRYTVIQGTDFELNCNVTGFPYPQVIWSKSGGQLGANARQTGNNLKITNTIPENSGVYVCLATNTEGSDQSATVVDVEQTAEVEEIKSLAESRVKQAEMALKLAEFKAQQADADKQRAESKEKATNDRNVRLENHIKTMRTIIIEGQLTKHNGLWGYSEGQRVKIRELYQLINNID